MRNEEQYDYERLPREQEPPQSHPSDGYHRVVNVPKRPPLIDKIPPRVVNEPKRPPLIHRIQPRVVNEPKRPPLIDRIPPRVVNEPKRPPLIDRIPPREVNESKRPPLIDRIPPQVVNVPKRPPLIDRIPPREVNEPKRPPLIHRIPPREVNVPKRPPLIDRIPPRVVNEPKRPPLIDRIPPRVVNEPKRPPLIHGIPPQVVNVPKRPPLLGKRPPLLPTPDKGGYSSYYSHVDCPVYDEGLSFSHDRKRARDDHSTNWQPNYRNMKGSFRGKNFYSSHYSKGWFPHKSDAPFFRESPASWKNSPHSRSSSGISNRCHSQKQSRTYSFHRSQNICKERSIKPSKTSGRNSFSTSSAVSSSKPSKLTEKELAEAETLEMINKGNLAEISAFEVRSMAPLFIDLAEEPKSNPTGGTEMFVDNQLRSRSEAISSKTREIVQVYQQDCETFGLVVKMLIEKDPSLEKSIQFSLKQNLNAIGEQCIEELKNFITAYDNSNQDLRPF
ncbi:periphilin-1-like isoform X2 [Mastomys coucha]|nr:periphilin-1-like isoform X2 [Mastomys coucha]XP_031227307.1 periphilin-1-like isoform X2 [Mastomys coucha]